MNRRDFIKRGALAAIFVSLPIGGGLLTSAAPKTQYICACYFNHANPLGLYWNIEVKKWINGIQYGEVVRLSDVEGEPSRQLKKELWNFLEQDIDECARHHETTF